MRLLKITLSRWLFPLLLLSGCVDAIKQDFRGTVDVVVVDGTITDLVEPQVIYLNRSMSDPATGRPGFLPIANAKVEIVIDSSLVLKAFETETGAYRLPADFRGQVGRSYQLRFTLSDGTRYQSSPEVMPAVPPIGRVTAEFNPKSVSPLLVGGRTAGHDFFLDTQDPADQANYYRWDWKLWEKREWCHTCSQGFYSVNRVTVTKLNTYVAGTELYEDCFYPPKVDNSGYGQAYFVIDYKCRTQCWAILSSSELNTFADTYTNGGSITHRKVAQIPFYQRNPALVEIRQLGLTPAAYRFFKNLQEQTQNNGGVADSPPTASIGNVKSMTNSKEIVVGYFTASSVAKVRYWLDRADAIGTPPGLFVALMGREPIPEGIEGSSASPIIDNVTNIGRPYTAVCVEKDNQTARKPEGWRQ